MIAMIQAITIAPKIENNKLKDPLFDGVVDGSMLLEVSDTNVLSMIVRDIDIEVKLSASGKLPVTETTNVYIITHSMLFNIHVY